MDRKHNKSIVHNAKILEGFVNILTALLNNPSTANAVP